MSSAPITDLSDYGFWAQHPDVRASAFAQMRESRPVHWVQQPPTPIFPDPSPEDGFWAVLSHAAIRQVSKEPETFCSSLGVHLDDLPPEMNEMAASFLVMDNPRHASVRGLVQKAFSLRAVQRIADQIEADAEAIVASLGEHETGEFVTRVALQLPVLTIMRMLGVPAEDRPGLMTAVEDMISSSDPDYLQGRDGLEVLFDAVMTLAAYAIETAAHKREQPGDDLITSLVEAELDGAKLTDAEIGAFFVLLASAGTDTTRQTTAHAMLQLTLNPDQRKLLIDDFDGHIDRAIDEFVRFASPVASFRRTATTDATVEGVEISAGQKVLLFYGSGNRDPLVFDDPETFDIRRDPNPHVGFGGGGPHYCMGSAIAKMQLRALFGRLLRTFPELEVSNPRFLISHFMNGITAMDMSTGRRA